MTLEDRARVLIINWRKQAKAFRFAKEERDQSEDEWYLNEAWEEALERCAKDLDAALAACERQRQSRAASYQRGLPAQRRPRSRPDDPVNDETPF